MLTPKISFVIPTHCDVQGLWSTIIDYKINHRQHLSYTELVVIDQSADKRDGKVVKDWFPWASKGFHSSKYVPYTESFGSSLAKEKGFQEANGEIVLCVDSHVILWPNSITSLIQFVEDHPESNDLLCGPMIYDDMQTVSTHLDNVWSSNQWGVWKEARVCSCGTSLEVRYNVYEHAWEARPPCYTQPWKPRCWNCGGDINLTTCKSLLEVIGNPFEVWAQGTGLLASKKSAWPGFPKGVKGFGGEEVIIHMKYRQKGDKVLCLPELKWTHRFIRANPPEYNLDKWYQVRNYVLGFRELGMSLDPIYDHFISQKHAEPLAVHLSTVHGIRFDTLKDKSDKQLADVHQSICLPEEHWKLILDGAVDPPCNCNKDTVNLAKFEQKPEYKTVNDWYKDIVGSKETGYHQTLHEIATQCDSAIEFCKDHTNITVPLVSGVKKTYNSYYYKVYPELEWLRKLCGSRFVFNIGNPITTEITNTDLLVLESVKRGDLLHQQLLKYHDKVNKFIIVFGTVQHAEIGEGSTPSQPIVGMLPGLRRFMTEFPMWSVYKDEDYNGGITVLTKVSELKEKLPSMISMASSFIQAKLVHSIKGTKCSEENFTKRLEICSLCPKRNNDRCGRCGCPIIEKASMGEQECPIGKWAQHGV